MTKKIYLSYPSIEKRKLMEQVLAAINKLKQCDIMPIVPYVVLDKGSTKVTKGKSVGESIRQIIDYADGVLFFGNWKESEHCAIQHYVAEIMGKEIYYAEDNYMAQIHIKEDTP